MDELSIEAKNTQSVNTIYIKNSKIVGHNTDIEGFKASMENTKFDTTSKKVLILGAGGVVPSIILALLELNVSKITVTNRTKKKAEDLKFFFKNIEIVEWGHIPNFDIIINATSLGLNKNDIIDLNFPKILQNKFFYDVIYNPPETNFLKMGRKLGNKTKNGKMMFILQASAAFKIWHGIEPEINKDIINLLEND